MEQQNTEQPKSEIANLTSPVPTRDLPPAAAKPEDKPIVLSFDEAVKLLPDGDNIHTFRNPQAGLMFGADWDRAALLDAMRASSEIQVTGPAAQAAGHGLAINSGGLLFIEAANYDATGEAA